MPPIPPHRVRLPDPSGLFKKLPREDQNFINELIGALQRELDRRMTVDTAQPELLLFSPDGSVWSVTVNNAGAVTTTIKSAAP